jgi:simple sugar transport system substrate-binding protein
MRKRWWLLSLLAVLALVGAGCGKKDKSEAGGVKRSDVNIQVVTHGQASDPFWSVVQNGVDQAKKDLGVNVTYRSPQKFDVVSMRQLIDSAIASKPDGLAVSIPDATALGPSVQKAVKAGIPVVTLNSGSDVSAKLGALAHVGQPEREAGVAAGKRLKAAGVTNALCINQEVGNAGLDLRCEGFKEGLGGGKSEVVGVDLTDPTSAKSRVENVLKKRPQVNGILTLGPTGADPTIAALKDLNKFGKIKIATFDLSPSVLNAVKNGDLLFAVDQQQFLQGYLPVIFLANYAKYGLIPGGNVPSGPNLITKEKAGQVVELSAKGIR